MPAIQPVTHPIVNTLDKQRLNTILADAGHPPGPAAIVRDVLDRARAVPPPQIPHDIVTMNSVVRLRYPWRGDAEVLSLVYPDSRSEIGDAVSVLAPLGASLLARCAGDEVRWMGARGPRSAVIESIEYQPERAGDLDR